MSTSPPTAPTLPVTSGAPMPATSRAPAPVLSAPVVFTPEEMTSAIRDLTQAVAGIRAFLAIPYGPQPPAPFAAAPPPQQPFAAHVSSPAASAQGPSPTAQGVPITQIRFPPSPSPLPDWLAAPVYTTAPGQPTALPPPASSSAVPFGGLAGYAAASAGVDGPLF